MATAEYNLLLVEDNMDDVVITRESFLRTNRSICIHHVDNGKKCLSFLRKSGEFSEGPTPDLVLLDLNLPVMDGRRVLAEVADDTRLKTIPIVVLSTSKAAADLLTTYQHGCRTYFVKPIDLHDFQVMVDGICLYWFEIATLPPAI